jgi:polygalacturonase
MQGTRRGWRAGPRRLVVIAALALACPAAAQTASSTGVFSVRDFGATGDGTTVDTPAINRAIEAAAAAGGGTVRFPAGTYLSASIRLKSHVGLYLEHGATIEAAAAAVAAFDEPEPNAWGDEHHYQDFGHSHWHNSLIWGEDLVDISIQGPGLIHGKGLVRSNNVPKGAGNKAIGLKNCRRVTIRDVSILRGGHFAILATGVDDLTIDNVRIDTVRDGIDIDACRNVRISNCHVNAPWDDAICLKSSYALGRARDTENVVITNSVVSGYDDGTFLDGTYKRTLRHNSIPTGRIKAGTESNGGFKNITISNCVFEYSRGLALEVVDGGFMEDVTVTNLAMRDIVNAPIFLRLGNRARGPETLPVSAMRRVNISNVVASNVAPDHGVLISGIPGHPIEDVRLSNIRIQYQGGGTKEEAAREVPEYETAYPEPYRFGRIPSWGFFVRHVTGIDLSRIDLSLMKKDFRPTFFLDDVARATLDHVSAPSADSGAPLVLRNVRDLVLDESLGFAAKRVARAERETLTAQAVEDERQPDSTVNVQLFDGKTLKTWKQYGGDAKFEVQDGAIVGTYVIGRESSYLVHELELEDFELKCEFKPEAGVNSGIQFRSLIDPEVRGKLKGYQYEIDATDRALTGGIYDQSRRGWLVPGNEPSAREAWKAKGGRLKIGEWNQMRVECRGTKIRTWLNDELMAELDDDATRRGFIAFQIHNTRDEKIAGKTVAWRNIWVRSLE